MWNGLISCHLLNVTQENFEIQAGEFLIVIPVLKDVRPTTYFMTLPNHVGNSSGLFLNYGQ